MTRKFAIVLVAAVLVLSPTAAFADDLTRSIPVIELPPVPDPSIPPIPPVLPVPSQTPAPTPSPTPAPSASPSATPAPSGSSGSGGSGSASTGGSGSTTAGTSASGDTAAAPEGTAGQVVPFVVLTPAPGEELSFVPTYKVRGGGASEAAGSPSNRFGPAELSSAAVFLGAAVLMAIFGLATTWSSRRRSRLGIAKPLKLSLR